MTISAADVERVATGYDPDPARSHSLRAEAYTEQRWADAEVRAIFGRTWQWVCHVEKLASPGSYVSATVAGMPVAVVRGKDGGLSAFYNVCKHRAHELLLGSGSARAIMCPHHAWTYDLSGQLIAARKTRHMDFDTNEICLD